MTGLAKRHIIVGIVLEVFLLYSGPLSAKGIGELLAKVMGVSDSTYVTTEKYNSYANVYMFDCTQAFDFSLSGGKQRLKLKPMNCPDIGVGVGRGLMALSYSKSINSIFGGETNHNSNFTFNILANRFGLQFYQRKVNGDAEITGSEGFQRYVDKDGSNFMWDGVGAKDGVPADLKGESFDGFHSRETGLDFYYVFNYKHFSYRAAYGYSTRQVRSAGSVVAGVAFSDFKSSLVLTHEPFMNLESFDKWRNDEQETFSYIPCVTQEVDFLYRKLSAKLGYGYNWAVAKAFVFNVTLFPMLSLKWSKITTYSLTDLKKQQDVYSGDWSLDFMGRSSLQWNNGKLYAGIYGDFTTFRYKKPAVNMSQVYAEMRICMGVYFDTFKKRKH